MRIIPALVLLVLGVLVIATGAPVSAASVNSLSRPTFDITTLSGKVASLIATAPLPLRVSSIIEREAEGSPAAPDPTPTAGITPTHVLSSPLDGTSVVSPAVTVNQDIHAASQNEPAIAVDPDRPNRIVVGANDYVTRTWSCEIQGVPCSALGDGYSGTYFSNDGGATWCCVATDPDHLGTLIPGVTRLSGGQYDAGGDSALAFDSRGKVYFAGLGFDRTAPPNTVAVNRGTFAKHGALRWGPPTFIGQTTDPAILNDKEWIAADSNHGSPFQDRVYVTWTRFVFDPSTGAYIESPIAFASSKDGGATFSDPRLIVRDVIFDQGSRVVVGPDGTVFVFWEGSRAGDEFNSIWMVKSGNGGKKWSKPVAIAPVVDIIPPANTVFRVNSFPAADVAPDGTVFVAWSSEVRNTASRYTADPVCASWISGTASVYANCHSAAVWSKLTRGEDDEREDGDHRGTFTTPVPILPSVDASNRRVEGPYPVTQPDGSVLNAPAPRRVDTFWPAIASPRPDREDHDEEGRHSQDDRPSSRVYMSAYAADVVSPWQTCRRPDSPTSRGRINCLELGPFVNNARLDYFVRNIRNGVVMDATTHPINSRYHFGGGFIGDYTGLAAGSDNRFHAVWTDTNNQQTVTWWYGDEFVPTVVHQQDIVVLSGRF